MQEKINLYKSITLMIIKMLSNYDYDEVDKLIYQRQSIINELDLNEGIDEFKILYDKEKINILDEDIKKYMINHMNEIKKEIRLYKMKQQGNSTYANVKKEKLNIFSKKA